MPMIAVGETARRFWTRDRTVAKRKVDAEELLSDCKREGRRGAREPRDVLISSFLALASALAFLLCSCAHIQAQQTERKHADSAAGQPSPEHTRIVYRPPPEAGPRHRIEGSTRGGPAALLTLNVLTPESIGLTTSAQPNLYWFNSIAVPYPVEVVIIDAEHAEPLVDVKLPKGLPAGIHQISLVDQGLELRVGIDYRWSVAVIVDPVNRSRDIVASGTIRRINLTPALASRVKSASPSTEPAVYAENGIWYEALDSASRMIVRSPARHGLRHIRASLLDQVALTEVAAYDRSR